MPNNSTFTIEDYIRSIPRDASQGLRVMFVYANTAGDPLVPVGLPLLYSILKQEGHDARLFDTTWYRSPFFNTDVGNRERAVRLGIISTNPADVGLGFHEEDIFQTFEKRVEEYRPHLIAISSLEMTARLGFALSNHLRKKGHYIPTIVGGEYATTSRELVFDYDDSDRSLDMICVGEGETPFRQLLREFSSSVPDSRRIRKIQGIWTRDETPKGFTNTQWGPPVNLDELPLGDISLFLDPELGGDPRAAYKPMYGKWWKSFTVERARGCHFKCRFCCHDDYHSMYTLNPEFRDLGKLANFRRDKDIERFMRDAREKIQKHGMDFVYIMDEDAIPPAGHGGLERTIAFTERYDAEVGLPFWIETRPETINQQVLDAMSNNMMGISVGVESGSEEIRRNVMMRKTKPEAIINAFHQLAKKGTPYVSANFIVGTPYLVGGNFTGENREQFMESINVARQIREVNPRVTPVFNLFQPYRGTGLRQDLIKLGVIPPDYLCGDYRNSSEAVGLGRVLSKQELIGMHRVAALYVHFPKKDWSTVRQAETDDALFDNLVAEASKAYFKGSGGPARPNRVDPLADDYTRGTM